MNISMLHPADQLVMMMERIYSGGMTTTSGGNLSILDCEGNIWITPKGIDKGSLTRADIMCVKKDGTVEGIHQPSVELPFHQKLYQKNPGIRAVFHVHSPALVAFSNIRKIPDTTLLATVPEVCGKLALAEYDVPGSKELGDKIAKKFEEGCKIAILENHGVVVGCESIFEAFFAFETLEYCARLQINASMIGTPKGLDEAKIRSAQIKQRENVVMDSFIPAEHTSAELAARRDICKFIKRSYAHKLFTSSQGTYSQRIGKDSFVITPHGIDRAYMEPEDLVLIKHGMKEEGKEPSHSVFLHQQIYQKHPEIHSVMIAHPSAIMAFAVTDCPFDSRTIPESYIVLRDVPKLPFGSSIMQPEMTSEVFSEKTPVALVENDCIIVTGNSLLNAFDRLEVAESTAASIISSRQIGKIVMISDEEIQRINQAFHLA